jgi:hypothetical protein
MAKVAILAHQLKAARALARLDQQELSNLSGVSVPTIKRMEAGDGLVRGNYENVAAVIGALEAAGVEFINGGQPGVRLKALASESDAGRKPSSKKTSARRVRPSDEATHALTRIPA